MKTILEKGKKESEGKLMYELDFEFITAMAQRMSHNKSKYAPYNWMKPMDKESLKQAIFRHVIEVMKGNHGDECGDLGHIEALATNAMMLWRQCLIMSQDKQEAPEIKDNSPNLQFDLSKGITVDTGNAYEAIGEIMYPKPDVPVIHPISEAPSTKLKAGKWYKEKDCGQFFVFRFNGQCDEEGVPKGYGFNRKREWVNNQLGWVTDGELEICPPKLLESILREHAKNLGYYVGAEVIADKFLIDECAKIIGIHYEGGCLIAELDNNMNIIVFDTEAQWRKNG